jgi:hypothetical protein
MPGTVGAMKGRNGCIAIMILLCACAPTLGPLVAAEEEEKGEGERGLAPRLRIRVVYEDGLDPVAGAEVRFQDLGLRGQSVIDPGWYGASHPYLRDRPWVSLRTGSSGTVLLPPFTTNALLWGKTPAGESWVEEVPNPDSLEATEDIGRRATYPTEYLLGLARGRRFHVRCLHATGRPGRDLPLVLRQPSPRDPSQVWELCRHTFSDTDGVATFFVPEDDVAERTTAEATRGSMCPGRGATRVRW